MAASSDHRLVRPPTDLANLERETENPKRKYCEIKTPEEMKEEILALTFKLAEANQKVERLTNVNLTLIESKPSIYFALIIRNWKTDMIFFFI